MSAPLLPLGLSLIALSLAGIAHSYARVTPLALPKGGRRALARTRARSESALLAQAEGQLGRLAALVEGRLPDRLSSPLSQLLSEAGFPLGLCASEFVVLTTAASALCAALGALYADAFGQTGLAIGAGALLGACLPIYRLRALRNARMQAISRALPSAIDLCALCMGAGLDFAAAVQNIVAQAPDPNAPLIQELQQLLRALALGSTRAAALDELQRAAPIASVQELVAAIQQGERKGTPLSQVLGVQAQLLRRRRSLAAEEAAARAGILLLLPLLLLMGCVLVILFSPFAVNGFGL